MLVSPLRFQPFKTYQRNHDIVEIATMELQHAGTSHSAGTNDLDAR